MIAPGTVEAIKARIDILDVLGDFIRLKRRGSNYLGLCPFHGEKTPSFTVSATKELYKCFGCGKSGNTITFLMEHEKLSYVEALQWLARRYNIEIEETFSSDEDRQAKQASDSLLILNQFAAQWFADHLQSEEGKNVALSYLEQRGFTADIISKFNIGYCPQGNFFVQAAKAAQYSEHNLLKSGLAVLRNGQLVDNYWERIIFPIHNNTGKIIGFGARVIGNPQKVPKYINTPENELYVKSRVLYGIYQARQAIDKNDECLLVEGYTDVTSMHQAGVENVVASGGTSLTTDQLRLINRYSRNLTIVYDGDAAGVRAALRGLDMALEEGLHVRVVLVPDGEDPDSYARKQGGEAFRQMVAERKQDFVLFQLEVLLKDAGGDVAKRSEAANRVAETLSKLNRPEDLLKYQDYLRRCAAILQMDEANLSAMVASYRRQAVSNEFKKSERVSVDDAGRLEKQAAPDQEQVQVKLAEDTVAFNRNLIRVLLAYGTLKMPDTEVFVAQHIFTELEDYPLPQTDETDRFYQVYKARFEAGETLDTDAFLYHPDPVISTLTADLMQEKHDLSERWTEVDKTLDLNDPLRYWEEVRKAIGYVKIYMIRPWLDENLASLKMAAGKVPEDYERTIEVHLLLKKEMKIAGDSLGTVYAPRG